MPLKRMRSGYWLCRTSRVSPSRTETMGSVKSYASTAEKEAMKKPNVAIRRSPKTNRDERGKSCTRGRRQRAKS